MTETEARALHDAGMELASPTHSHADVLMLSDAELRREMVESREAVEAITGKRCLTLSYPVGDHDRRVERAAADAGYQLAFATGHGAWRRFAVPRVSAPTTAAPETLIPRLGLSAENAASSTRSAG